MKRVSGDPYQLATLTILKYEIDCDEIAWWGLTELRDFATHIAKAMQCDTDEEAILQLNFAEEHLRRAAIETMHEYASVVYNELKPKLVGSDFKYWILCLPLPDRYKVKQIRDRISQELINARINKGNNWVQSVTNFFNAIEALHELSNEFPPDYEVRKRKMEFGFGILTLVGVVIAIMGAIHFY